MLMWFFLIWFLLNVFIIAISIFVSIDFNMDITFSQFIKDTKIKHVIVGTIFPLIWVFAWIDVAMDEGRSFSNTRLYKFVHVFSNKPIRKQGGK